MTITAQLFDGTTLEFPDGTSTTVIQNTVKRLTAERQGATPAGQRREAMLANIGQAKVGTLGMSPAREAEQEQIDAAALTDMRDPGMGVTALLGATQGATFGFGDEISAALAAAMSNGLSYEQALAFVRDQQQAAQDARPGLTLGANIAGGLTSSIGSGIAGMVAKGATLPAQVGRGALAGALEGGAYGFGAGEGGIANRAANAAVSAAIGAGAGGALPVAGEVVKRTVVNPLVSALGIKSDARAAEMLATYLRRAGMSEADVQAATAKAAQEGQPEFVAADAMGVTGQRALGSIARQPGDFRQSLMDQLERRQASQGERLSGFIGDAFGGVKTADERAAAMKAARGEAANVAYDAARSGAAPVDVRSALAVIDERIGSFAGSGVSMDAIGNKLAGYRSRLAAKNPAASRLPGETGMAIPDAATAKTAVELSDFDAVLQVKRDVQDAIGEAVRAGRNNEARELGKLVSALDSALEEASPAYRQANDEFARASREIGAIDLGREAARPGTRTQDAINTASRLTDAERGAFRAGYIDPFAAKVEGAAPGVNKARMFTTDKQDAMLGSLADNPDLLKRRIAREGAMFETRNAAMGGSRTADNLAEMGATNDMSSSALMSAASGQIAPLITGLIDRAMRGAQGTSPATRELIAKALMSPDPAAVLAAGAKKLARNSSARAMIEALIRGAAVKGFEAAQ
jgi:hypothetical protein